MPHDVFHILAFQRLVCEKVVDDRRQGRPVIVPVKQSIELRGRLLQEGQPFSLGGNQRGCGFPGGSPVRSPLGNEAGMVRSAVAMSEAD